MTLDTTIHVYNIADLADELHQKVNEFAMFIDPDPDGTMPNALAHVDFTPQGEDDNYHKILLTTPYLHNGSASKTHDGIIDRLIKEFPDALFISQNEFDCVWYNGLPYSH